MSEALSATAPAPDGATAASSIYRAVWRWHFYAGLFVLPFMILLAATGALYLFHDEIEQIVHRPLLQVEQRASARVEASRWLEAALAAHPGTAVKLLPPASETSSAEITVKTESGQKLAVYVDPYDARVLGSLPDRGTIMWTIRRLHSLDEFGTLANGVMEIVGGWAIVLVATGFYLWWPRNGTGGVVTIRGAPRRRVFWRDVHAVAGAFAGLWIAFLAVTGMPWSVFWGHHVNTWANGQNFGYPTGVRVAVPMSDEHLAHVSGPTSWSLEQAKTPLSTASSTPPIGVDEAVAIFDRLGLTPGYAVSLPTGPTGVYSGSVYPDDLSKQRVVHLDQYSGKPLIDMSFADYGPLGKALEWGINVHMGQEWGLANQFLMLAVCVAILVMAVSAVVMWWMRRPAGRLGVPPPPRDRRAVWGVAAILGVGGAAFPLTGATLLAAVAIEMSLKAVRTR